MTTNHKPATPLPFTVEEGSGCFEIHHAEGGRVTSLHYAHGVKAQKDCQREDAAYIAHAANAYPKLVAELKHALYLERSKKYAATLRTLLRELGEDA